MSVISRQTDPRVSQRHHIPGEEGVWVFILGDMMAFAVFFATYLFYRGEQPDLFATSQHTLSQTYGVINTLLLLTSSLFVVLGVRGIRSRARVAPWLFTAAMVCGLGFAVVKFLEYGAKLDAGITPATNDFYMYYFVLTGLHFFHLLLGMGVLAFLVRLARKPTLTDRQLGFVEGGACFWHMVDLLWIVLFPLLYLIK